MRSTKRTLALLLVAMLSTGALGACNTMAGFGEDLGKAGEKIEGEAESHIDCDESTEC